MRNVYYATPSPTTPPGATQHPCLLAGILPHQEVQSIFRIVTQQAGNELPSQQHAATDNTADEYTGRTRYSALSRCGDRNRRPGSHLCHHPRAPAQVCHYQGSMHVCMPLDLSPGRESPKRYSGSAMGYVLCGTFPRYLLSTPYMPRHPTPDRVALPGPGDGMVGSTVHAPT